MATIMVGKKTDKKICRILTTCADVDDPKEIEFEVSSGKAVLLPGKPSWANYVKGVIMNFKGLYFIHIMLLNRLNSLFDTINEFC